MNQLTLEWMEAGQVKKQTIAQPTSANLGYRIGRDPAQCHLVLTHPTVSGLHVEIFFDPQRSSFYLRNLRATNPPRVDRQKVTDSPVVLHQGSVVWLGQVELRVTAIDLAIAPTLLLPPSPDVSVPLRPAQPPYPIIAVTQDPAYGLQCSHCHQISPYERLDLGCPWCGTSLAGADSVLMPP